MNALAYEKDGVWHVHSGNQFASRTGGIAAGALGIDPKHVVVHNISSAAASAGVSMPTW